MKINRKIILGIITLGLLLCAISYGIYSNIQYQNEVKLAQKYKQKLIQEKQEINRLQKNFSVENTNSQTVFNELSKLKLSTKEAKLLQLKCIKLNKKDFSNLENKIISELFISDKDKRFNEISNLQTNTKSIQIEIDKINNMTEIFTKVQINEFTQKLKNMLNVENAQIASLQKSIDEKIEKEKIENEAKQQTEAITETQNSADYGQSSSGNVSSSDSSSYQSDSSTDSYSSDNNGRIDYTGDGAGTWTQQNPDGSVTAGNGDQTLGGWNVGVVPDTNNGVGWATSPVDVPDGAVIQPSN
ncbi:MULTISPECIES: hypothetical protein [unclassified Enterococcus]|uniref:hypothetical protein n=1 Tax=unclassified Enterococcus TaxID=2608891 RepID=UPI00155335E3|nr:MULTISPECIES: hypothetical protein [unclassified Enterococcus]MBS7576097.1 hypothetical protein [Enterococcus sp. MMGLQ5-2]MBS7583330.1 hypothetical protein [Enterococcus sp. MMGLQ5-1]NPD11190.1 hypothetical protein [Enterococcus sp. MMGLQ5-1]NPD35933.1 hypothetical protein [Enterococcus sp. MMGLQ5-2]